MTIGASRDLTASDTPNDRFNWLMVTTTAGDVTYDTEGGNSYTMTNVPVGVFIPVGKATNVQTSSTAVGFVVV